MRITSFEFANIKSFKSLRFELDKTRVLIGQNDHGKSSILKAIDIVLNKLDDTSVLAGSLHPDLAEVLLPIYAVPAKARRITVEYQDDKGIKKLYITVRTDLTFVIHEKIGRNPATTTRAIAIFRELRQKNKFILIPALRDASSQDFQELFSRLLREHGLSKIIPQKAGGTPREYRILKDIREKISTSIKPYINEALLPQIESNFGFSTQHTLALKFDADVQDVGQWILDNLKLGFQITDKEESTLALSEAGSGVQSGVLLALHRLGHQAAAMPDIQFILAVEEPEAFLHPQKQKELYQDIRDATLPNLRTIITTHSPYIVSETRFTEIGWVRKDGLISSLFVSDVKNARDAEIFDTYSDEVNTNLFFSDKLVIVEGESDIRVIKVLLNKKLGKAAHKVSVISSSGNANFSPYLKMIRSFPAKMPHIVVTDFDSLTTATGRAVLTGAKAAGYSLSSESAFLAKVDASLDKGEAQFTACATDATSQLAASGLKLFVFTADLEHVLISDQNKAAAAKIMSECSASGKNYKSGYDLGQLRKILGSKGVPLNPLAAPECKRPFIHKKVAETIDLDDCHPDITRLLTMIEAL